MVITMHSPKEVGTFPEAEVTEALSEWWDAEMDVRRDDPFAKPGTLYDLVVDMDSLSMVNGLLVLEKILGFEAPVTAIKRGGYRDRQEMIDHLVPRIGDIYRKHRNLKTIRTPVRHDH